MERHWNDEIDFEMTKVRNRAEHQRAERSREITAALVFEADDRFGDGAAITKRRQRFGIVGRRFDR